MLLEVSFSLVDGALAYDARCSGIIGELEDIFITLIKYFILKIKCTSKTTKTCLESVIL
jgi:hypothetical protein